MPKKCPKFVAEYLIPSLNSKRFGRHLQWLDKDNKVFQLSWCHKAYTHWSEGEAEVFVEWDKIKGHYQPNNKDYFSKSKQRFRALLYKLCRERQLEEIKSEMKSKKVYYITGIKKLRRNRKSSSADSGIFSTDDMTSDNNELLSEDVNGDEMNDFCNVNSSINNLDDHNYSKCLIDNSDLLDLLDTRVDHREDVILSVHANECVDKGKKVLVEQNNLYYNDMNKFHSNVPTDFSQGLFYEDLQTGSKNSVFKRNDGFIYEPGHSNTLGENQTPVESTEALSSFNVDMNVQFDKILSDLEGDDISNFISYYFSNRI